MSHLRKEPTVSRSCRWWWWWWWWWWPDDDDDDDDPSNYCINLYNNNKHRFSVSLRSQTPPTSVAICSKSRLRLRFLLRSGQSSAGGRGKRLRFGPWTVAERFSMGMGQDHVYLSIFLIDVRMIWLELSPLLGMMIQSWTSNQVSFGDEVQPAGRALKWTGESRSVFGAHQEPRFCTDIRQGSPW